MVYSKAGGANQDYDDIPSPRVQTAKAFIEWLDVEESAKLIKSRSNQETIIEEESSFNVDEWLSWDEAKATQVIASTDKQAQKLAFYRLGLIK